MFLLINRSPEFFYPNVFVKIKEKIPITPTTTNVSSAVFHGTHFEEALEICQGKNAIFRGNMKLWRLLDYKSYDQKYCSYHVHPGKTPEPMTLNNSIPFGPFVWFGTRRDESDNYGPCQFEFNFTSLLKAYQRCRNNQRNVCYRVAGTLVYKWEVCHIVMICCLDDNEYKGYPLITANNTRYFKPPNSLNDANPLAGLQFETMINEYQQRHEHVTFALYLPNNKGLYLSYKDGKMRLTPHNTYCILSRNKECFFKDDQLPMSVDKLKVITRWMSHDGEGEEEMEPVVGNIVKNTALDEDSFEWFSSEDETQSYHDVKNTTLDEDSFEWFSSADETEYYHEGDQYDFRDFEDYDDLDFKDFNDEQSDSRSNSTVTVSYDSSTSSTMPYDSEDYD